MFSKTGFINFLLIAGAVFFSINAYNILIEKEKPVSKIQNEQKPVSRVPEKKILKKEMLTESAYNTVADKNLFSPDREEFIPERKEAEPEIIKQPSALGQGITLYGVIITDNYKTALINNPVREAGDRENKWIKEGDTLGELKIASIQKESILFIEDGKKYEVLLYDKKKTGGISQPSAAKAEAKPNVVVSESEKKQPDPSSVSKENKPADDSDEYEIVNTPFGKLKRKKKK